MYVYTYFQLFFLPLRHLSERNYVELSENVLTIRIVRLITNSKIAWIKQPPSVCPV